MDDLNQKIDKVGAFLNFISEIDTFENIADIRSITIHSLAQTTQSYLFSLFLNKELENIEYVKNNISEEIKQEHLETINYVYDGFLKNAYFINLFVYVENHIRQIALHFEKSVKINVNSITITFKNLRDLNKVNHFSKLDDYDEELFTFYCYIRNTMHNVGFQTESDKSIIIIIDENSIFKLKKKELRLKQNSPNNLTFEELLILHEQVIKLILKINSLIPQNEFIKHKFSDIGFNN